MARLQHALSLQEKFVHAAWAFIQHENCSLSLTENGGWGIFFLLFLSLTNSAIIYSHEEE